MTLLLCAVVVGGVYPICREKDYEPGSLTCKWYAKPLMHGCDTHYVHVSAMERYQATREDSPKAYDFEELVVSQEAQVLPFAVVRARMNRHDLRQYAKASSMNPRPVGTSL